MDAAVIEAANIEKAVCIAALALLARYDLRERRLPLGLLLAANTVGLIFAVIRNGTSPAAYLGDLAAGAFVLLLSAVSRGRIGSGAVQ